MKSCSVWVGQNRPLVTEKRVGLPPLPAEDLRQRLLVRGIAHLKDHDLGTHPLGQRQPNGRGAPRVTGSPTGNEKAHGLYHHVPLPKQQQDRHE